MLLFHTVVSAKEAQRERFIVVVVVLLLLQRTHTAFLRACDAMLSQVRTRHEEDDKL